MRLCPAQLSSLLVAFVLIFFVGACSSRPPMNIENISDIHIPVDHQILRSESSYQFQSSFVYYDVRFTTSAAVEEIVQSILQSKYYLSEADCLSLVQKAIEESCPGLPDGLKCEYSDENQCVDYLRFDDTAWVQTEQGYYFQYNELVGSDIVSHTVEYLLESKELHYIYSYST